MLARRSSRSLNMAGTVAEADRMAAVVVASTEAAEADSMAEVAEDFTATLRFAEVAEDTAAA